MLCAMRGCHFGRVVATTLRPTRRARIAVRVWQHGNVLPGPAGGTGRRAHLRSEWLQSRMGSTPVPGTGQVIGADRGADRRVDHGLFYKYHSGASQVAATEGSGKFARPSVLRFVRPTRTKS